MFNRTHFFTRGVITGGLLSLAVATTSTQAASAQSAQPAAAQAQQTQATPDAELVAKVRKAIADDKALAPYAQTLKIIASDGLVSLKGAVRSDADKKAIGQKADEIVGAKNVMNNLLVTAEAGKGKPDTP